MRERKHVVIPHSFAPILWSYDIAALDVMRDRETIIAQAVNYGTLHHWRWLVAQYGRAELAARIAAMPASAIRPRARRLALLLFDGRSYVP